MRSEARRVFIVDDHALVREGLIELLAGHEGLRVCGEAHDIASAYVGVGTLQPDVVVIDLSLGAESGFDLIELLAARWPELPLLVLSAHDEAAYAERALAAGARGYISKQESTSELVQALGAVLAGSCWVSGQGARPARERRPRPALATLAPDKLH